MTTATKLPVLDCGRLAELVLDLVCAAAGPVTVAQLVRRLTAAHRTDATAVRAAVQRLCDDKLLEKCGKWDGSTWRRVDGYRAKE